MIYPKKDKLSILFKSFLLMIIVIGFSGIGSAQAVTSSLSTANVPSTTVNVEQGFSGTVTIKDPLLNKTSNVTVNYHPYSYGSGFIVNKNGYIITAFHVISDSRTLDNKNQLKKMSSEDIKWYVEEAGLLKYLKYNNPSLAYKIFKDVPKTQNDHRKALERATDQFIKNGWISTNSYKSEIYVKGNALNKVNTSNSLKASLIGSGNSKTGEDIALLKVNTKGIGLPVATVSSKIPKINSKIAIYGYPVSKKSSSPSKSSGNLNVKAPNPKGTVYYETNAITAEGYSGGPVINSQNKVIGILAYGVYTNKSKKIMGSLFLSSSYIQKICKKYGVPIIVN
ncbi:S1 family peptidase [Methanobacterium sp.]|uniref:S1 family peptidase n=1 Tax=Methanobacterium sp. TaxID=2164 RepID=UPI003C74BC8A